MDPRTTFEKRILQFAKAITSVKAKLDQIALLRLLVVVAMGLLCWWTATWGGVWWMGSLLAGFIAFGVVVRWNERVRVQLRYQEMLHTLNKEEVARLDGKLGEFDQGAEFADPSHGYSSDLDLFGKHALFQLVSRAGTILGRQRLAAWLRQGAGPEEVRARQDAARRLAAEIDWRQHFQAAGRLEQGDAEALTRLRDWLQAPGLVAAKPWLRWIPWVMWAQLGSMIALVALGQVPGGWILASLAANFIVNRSQGKAIARIAAASEQRSKLLSAWATLIAHMEAMPEAGPLLASAKARLAQAGQPASAEIARLGQLAGNLDPSRLGFLHPVINTLFFWDILSVAALERWKERLRDRLMDWFEVIGEVEALASLSAVRFAFPEWADPEVVEGAFLLVAEELGHPLIPADKRVANPVDIAGNGQVWLVTGSNMSGKSTYLRTLGINVALALAGAPVCARAMRLSPMRMVTSMRTLDNLEESTSSFYAELKRLQMVLAAVREPGHVLFLLDEILKGTNSRDRHAGARALVQQLHQLGGSGLVSTHDIELVDMAGQLPEAIHNYSFNCTVSAEGTLHFDYRLTPGQCLSMNATALMRAMGIEV